jgi:site-specific recombinase XerC
MGGRSGRWWLSARRARKAHAVLSQVLASAVEGGRLTRNVAAGIKLPKVQRAEMHFLDAEQVETLAEVIDPRYGADPVRGLLGAAAE